MKNDSLLSYSTVVRFEIFFYSLMKMSGLDRHFPEVFLKFFFSILMKTCFIYMTFFSYIFSPFLLFFFLKF